MGSIIDDLLTRSVLGPFVALTSDHSSRILSRARRVRATVFINHRKGCLSRPHVILKAKAGADLPETGIKESDTFYMVRDGNSGPDLRFRVVKWDRVKWVCSCGKGRCEHKFLVNEFLFKEMQAR